MKPRWGWPETSDLRGDVIMIPLPQCAHFNSETDTAPQVFRVLTGALTHLDTTCMSHPPGPHLEWAPCMALEHWSLASPRPQPLWTPVPHKTECSRGSTQAVGGRQKAMLRGQLASEASILLGYLTHSSPECQALLPGEPSVPLGSLGPPHGGQVAS